jgi:hypothetical protein
VLLRWIESGANGTPEAPLTLSRLELTPNEILFSAEGQQTQLKAVAVWSDGTSEDVTALCRFQTNDDQIADITQDGLVLSGSPGDTHVVVFYDRAVVPVPVIRPVTDQFGDRYPVTPTPTRVDELVVQKLRKVGIVQSDLCTDAEFLRRVSLDVTGTLPTVKRSPRVPGGFEVRKNEAERLTNCSSVLVTWHGGRHDLCDFTGNSDDKLNNVTPVKAEASKQWYAWIEKRVRDNVPYDKIVEGIVMAVSRDPGETYQQYCENVSKTLSQRRPGSGRLCRSSRACRTSGLARIFRHLKIV